MSKKTQFIAQVGFYLLSGGLLAYAATRTFDFVSSTMPSDKQELGYLFLLSTGVGALIWLMVLLHMAQGSKQRGIAFMMGIIDLGGEMMLVYADTMRVAGDNGQALKMSASDMKIFIVGSVVLMSINIMAAYAFKLFDPAAEAAEKAKDLADDVTDAAYKELNTPEAKLAMINELAPVIRKSVMDSVSAEIYAQAGKRAVSAPQLPMDPNVIEVGADGKPLDNWMEAVRRQRTENAQSDAPAVPPFPIGVQRKDGPASAGEMFPGQDEQPGLVGKTPPAS